MCAGDAETVLTLVRQGGRVPVRPAQGEHCSSGGAGSTWSTGRTRGDLRPGSGVRAQCVGKLLRRDFKGKGVPTKLTQQDFCCRLVKDRDSKGGVRELSQIFRAGGLLLNLTGFLLNVG